MEGKGEGFTLTLPLILDEKKQGKLEETEADLHCDYTTGTSFFKTLFNGLNALSGQALNFLFPISFSLFLVRIFISTVVDIVIDISVSC